MTIFHKNTIVFYVIWLLCLMSVSHITPLVCENLDRPLDHLALHHLVGRWTTPAHEEAFKDWESASFICACETSKISFVCIQKFGDSCKYGNSKLTLEGSGFNFEELNISLNFVHRLSGDTLQQQVKECCAVVPVQQKEGYEQQGLRSSRLRSSVWTCFPLFWWIQLKSFVKNRLLVIQLIKRARMQMDKMSNRLIGVTVCDHKLKWIEN